VGVRIYPEKAKLSLRVNSLFILTVTVYKIGILTYKRNKKKTKQKVKSRDGRGNQN
jgi:hypothetical protein